MNDIMSMIRPFAGNYVPQGWLPCDGRSLRINENVALYSLLGTRYGGDGISTFNLPDLSYRAVMGGGMGNNPRLPDIDAGLARKNGSVTVKLDDDEMAPHTHIGVLNAMETDATTNVPTGLLPARPVALLETGDSADAMIYKTGDGSNLVDMAANSVTITPAGGNGGHYNMQPYLGVTFLICVQGIFPARQ